MASQKAQRLALLLQRYKSQLRPESGIEILMAGSARMNFCTLDRSSQPI
jgi:hypothetical protein